MGERIYNGESGVLSPLEEIRARNRRENAAVWARLHPDIRARYERQIAARKIELKSLVQLCSPH